MRIQRTASARLYKASNSPAALFAFRALVIAAGALAALTVGTWAAVTFGVTLPPVLFISAVRSARRTVTSPLDAHAPATTNHPPVKGSDEPSASITASVRTRQERPGSHSGLTEPDESATGEHGFDCLMCDYPWRTADGCGFCTWKPGDTIGFAGLEFDAPPVPTPTAADVQRVACPVCDWKPIDGCIWLDGTNAEHGMRREEWCQFCTWTPGDECPNCTYPTAPMKSAKCITDNMTPDELKDFQDDLAAFHKYEAGREVTADGLVSAGILTADERLWCAELNHVDDGTVDPDGHTRRRIVLRVWIWKYLVDHVARTRHAA